MNGQQPNQNHQAVAAQNGPNPNAPNGGIGHSNSNATSNSQLPPKEPEKNLVIAWNGPEGCFSGWGLDEDFPST
ncbi:hypothetical protein FRC14_000832 [Serendipita sp. 396]|nr:hypothetical protein FRC14_000832 [Serendipita sp. 396]KAG8857472.1 hypothetical protein FRC20_000273 [Serendipita sp. 405]KAG9033174.1 hypothetical protein FS842_003986 [Serendipita sp. 407]